MAGHTSKLRETAIAAYGASRLKQADVQKNEKALSLIKRFLSLFDVEAEVDSNPFEIEGIRFYVDPLEDSDGVYGHSIMASRKCPDCGEHLVTSVKDYNLDEYSPAIFGQWLSESHLCEFRDNMAGRAKAGFVRPD
jgi:hypothetical protein